eukprot:TRINITY_DN10137_c0_g1_i2.p1 TRINITY_DN10137_c0_g1~~TRINITY_DN10137_c0_g1_i2.p1  ORF type:complete len:395 (+),score=45.83 TRINITY_DN10137_c0_g1_i2:47-1186(+)
MKTQCVWQALVLLLLAPQLLYGITFEMVKEASREYATGEKDLTDAFVDYIHKFGKTYEGKQEYNRRFAAFRLSMGRLNFYESVTKFHPFGLTKFSDETPEDFNRLHLTKFQDVNATLPPALMDVSSGALNFNYSWVAENKVGPVLNETSYSTSYAFAVAGNIASQHAMVHKSNEVAAVSAMQLIACGKECSGVEGCVKYEQSFVDVMKNLPTSPGIATSASYPYDPKDHGTCKKTGIKVGAKVKSYKAISTDETTIAETLHKEGPLAASLNAEWLQDYKAGIISNPWQCFTNPDHAVLLVGFGTSDQTHSGSEDPFWLIQNSWGSDWGETPDCYLQTSCQPGFLACPACETPLKRGYFRIYRGSGQCGINKMVSTAIVE